MISSKYIVFAKVAETKNITKAAELLNYTQPAVSQIITNLEKEYGFPLVIRSKSGVKLTDNGKKILVPIQKILSWERVLEQRHKNILGLKEGTLRIGTISSINMSWLPIITEKFLEKYPKVKFELVQGDYDSTQENLINDNIDCGFLVDSLTKDLVFFPLITDEFYVILPSHHPLTKFKSIQPEQLSNVPFILPAEGLNYDIGTILHSIPDVDIRITAHDDYLAITFVEKNLGVSILPKLIIDKINSPVQYRPLNPRQTRKLGIALHTKQYASPLAIEFIDFATHWINQHKEETIITNPTEMNT